MATASNKLPEFFDLKILPFSVDNTIVFPVGIYEAVILAEAAASSLEFSHFFQAVPS